MSHVLLFQYIYRRHNTPANGSIKTANTGHLGKNDACLTILKEKSGVKSEKWNTKFPRHQHELGNLVRRNSFNNTSTFSRDSGKIL
jgi:hypothetical protein